MKHKIEEIDVPRETFREVEKLQKSNHVVLKQYTNQLLWWNKRINLVSRDVSRGTIEKHVQHSLLISRLEAFLNSDFIVDAGSGGGLPGLPLACCFPKKQFVINDIVSKKIIAVRQTILKLNLENAKAKALSISKLPEKLGSIMLIFLMIPSKTLQPRNLSY